MQQGRKQACCKAGDHTADHGDPAEAQRLLRPLLPAMHRNFAPSFYVDVLTTLWSVETLLGAPQSVDPLAWLDQYDQTNLRAWAGVQAWVGTALATAGDLDQAEVHWQQAIDSDALDKAEWALVERAFFRRRAGRVQAAAVDTSGWDPRDQRRMAVALGAEDDGEQDLVLRRWAALRG